MNGVRSCFTFKFCCIDQHLVEINIDGESGSRQLVAGIYRFNEGIAAGLIAFFKQTLVTGRGPSCLSEEP
ncbi:hypothetical protein [Pedobacter sp. SYP-B3415]|uniref:hypothetical protein n=1 Tax=Pedobacter sp. SYP-B3415 TaxID=2496641 RepID=UPI001F0EBA4C|nr:hypothetical protein [Pedobacter sp. SYP-B3415]